MGSSVIGPDATPCPGRTGLPLIAYIAFLLTMVAAEVVTHARGFIYLQMDAQVFLPPAISAARGEGLRNLLWNGARAFDPAGEGRLVYHGFLFQTLLVPLMPTADGPGLVLALGFLQAIILLVSGVIFLHRTERPPTWSDVLLAAAGVLVVAATLEGFAGRPEALVMLFVTLGVIGFHRSTSLLGEVVMPGILIGLTGATSPVSGIFSGLALTTWLSLRHRPAAWALRTIAAAGVSVLTFGILLLLVFPFEVRALIEGHRLHNGLSELYNFSYLMPVWVRWRSIPLAGLLWLIAAAVLAQHLMSRWRDLPYPLLPFVLLLLCGWGLFFFAVQFSAMAYNAIGFLPVIIAILLAGRESLAQTLGWPWAQYAMRALVAVALIIPALGFVRHLLLFHCYLNQGMHLDEARAAVAPLFQSRGPNDSVYAIGNNAMLLTERHGCLRVLLPGEAYPLDSLLLGVEYENNMCRCERVLPPVEIQENHFRDEEPRWLGFDLGESMPGYQFVVARVVGATPPGREER